MSSRSHYAILQPKTKPTGRRSDGALLDGRCDDHATGCRFEADSATTLRLAEALAMEETGELESATAQPPTRSSIGAWHSDSAMACRRGDSGAEVIVGDTRDRVPTPGGSVTPS